MNTVQYGEQLVNALSDEGRKHILRVLACGEKTTATLCTDLLREEDDLLADLAILVAVNLVSTTPSGDSIVWHLTPDSGSLVSNFLKNNKMPATEEYCKLIK